MKLKDRVALVTGGGSGIGRAIALLFAAEGAQVAVNDVNMDAAQKTVAEIGTGTALQADVADSAQVRAMFDEIAARFGGLDVLVNNAGIAETAGSDTEAMLKTFEARVAEAMAGQPITTQWDVVPEMSDEDWHQMLSVHLYGTFHCTREALKLMKAGAAIVNMSSILGLQGNAAVPHYSAAKAGILGFTRSVAQEVGSRGIRVNAICPGYIDTPMTQILSPLMRLMTVGQTPLGRIGEPRDVAAVALFLASDDAAFLTGQWISPNGGLVTI